MKSIRTVAIPIFAALFFMVSLPVAGFAQEPACDKALLTLSRAYYAINEHNQSGGTKVRAEKLDEAAEKFDQAIKYAPNCGSAYRAKGRFLHIYRQDFQAARKEFERAIQLAPEQAANHLSLVLVLFDATQWADTVAASDELLRKFDRSEASELRTYIILHCRICRHLSLLALGQVEAADAELAKIKELDENVCDENSNHDLADFPKMEGQAKTTRDWILDEETAVFRLRYLEKDTSKWFELALNRLMSRNIARPQVYGNELKWLLPKLDSVVPMSGEEWYRRAEVRRRIVSQIASSFTVDASLGYIPPAVADYDAAEKLGFQSPAMSLHRGKMLMAIGNEVRAIADFENCFKASKSETEIPDARNSLETAIDLARKLGDEERLFLFLNYCAKHFGHHHQLELLDILLARDRADELLQNYDMITEGGRVPLSFNDRVPPQGAIRSLQSHLVAAGRLDDAFNLLTYCDPIVDPLGDNENDYERRMLNRLAWEASTPSEKLRRAEALRYFGRTAQAVKIYEELQQQYPQSSLVTCNRALALLELGKAEAAARSLEQIPDSGRAMKAAVQGAILQARGNFAEAIAQYTNALEADPYLPGVRGRRALARFGNLVEANANFATDAEFLNDLRGCVLERDGSELCFPFRVPKHEVASRESSRDPLVSRLVLGDIVTAIIGWETERRSQIRRNPSRNLDLGGHAAVAWLVLDDLDRVRSFVKLFGAPDGLPGVIADRNRAPIEGKLLSPAAVAIPATGFEPANDFIALLFQPLIKRIASPTSADDFFLLSWNAMIEAEQRLVERVVVGQNPSNKPIDRDKARSDSFASMKRHFTEAVAYLEKGLAIPVPTDRDVLLEPGTSVDVHVAKQLISEISGVLPNITIESGFRDIDRLESLLKELRLAVQPTRFAIIELQAAASKASRAANWEGSSGDWLQIESKKAWTSGNLNESIEILGRAAQEKTVKARYALGRAFHLGYAVAEDQRQANRMYMAALKSTTDLSEPPTLAMREFTPLTRRKSEAKDMAPFMDVDDLPSFRAKVAKSVDDQRLDLAASAWKEKIKELPDRLDFRLARLEFLASHASVMGHEEHGQELQEILKRIPESDAAQRANLCLDRLRLLSSLKLLSSLNHDDEMFVIDEYRRYKPFLETGISSHETLGWLALDLRDFKGAFQHLSLLLPKLEREWKELQSEAFKVPSARAAASRAEFRLMCLKQQLNVLKVLQINPEDGPAMVQRANASHVVGWGLGARSDGDLARVIEPNSVLLWCWGVGQAIRYGTFAEAQQNIDAALKLNPKSAEVYICRGALRQAECRFDDALADFDRAIQLSHCRPEPYFRRAQILFYRGELDQAFESLATAILMEPTAYSLLLPTRLDNPATISAPPPNPRIASTGPHAAEVAAAQLKLARGDLEGAEADLMRIGDDAVIFRNHYRATRPTLPREKQETYQSQQDWNKQMKQLQDLFNASQAADWKAHGGQADWATSFTLGLARATHDEDQELFARREHPLAAPRVRSPLPEQKIELAHWNFRAADAQNKQFSAFADLIPSVAGPAAWEANQSILAEYRPLKYPLRYAPFSYCRSRLNIPLRQESNPPQNAHVGFAAAFDQVLRPVSFEDLYIIVQGMIEGTKADGYGFPDNRVFIHKDLVKRYDLHLLSLAKQAEQLPTSDYVDPFLVTNGLHRTKRDALTLLRSALENAMTRGSEGSNTKEYKEAVARVDALLAKSDTLPTTGPQTK